MVAVTGHDAGAVSHQVGPGIRWPLEAELRLCVSGGGLRAGRVAGPALPFQISVLM
jgi:hypothetical protein